MYNWQMIDRSSAHTIWAEINCYILMAEDFNQAVLGNRDLLFPPEDIIHNMRVIDAIFASARTGQRIAL